jgi:hypothetical protein
MPFRPSCCAYKLRAIRAKSTSDVAQAALWPLLMWSGWLTGKWWIAKDLGDNNRGLMETILFHHLIWNFGGIPCQLQQGQAVPGPLNGKPAVAIVVPSFSLNWPILHGDVKVTWPSMFNRFLLVHSALWATLYKQLTAAVHSTWTGQNKTEKSRKYLGLSDLGGQKLHFCCFCFFEYPKSYVPLLFWWNSWLLLVGIMRIGSQS